KIGIAPTPSRLAARRDGPAFAAGLRTGDVPVRVGAAPAPASAPFLAAVADESNEGPAVVRRGADEVSIALPPAAARKEFRESIAGLEEATTEVWVTLRPGDLPARRAGLPEAFRILEVDGRPVTSAGELNEAVVAAGKAG